MTPVLPALVLLFSGAGCTDGSATGTTGTTTGTPGDSDTATEPEDAGCGEADITGHTVGLLQCHSGADQGYTLLAPLDSTDTFLIDPWGRVLHSWSGEHTPGSSVYLLDDGTLLRPAKPARHPVFRGGGVAGLVQRIGWDGEVLWEHELSSDTSVSHHDVAPLPNGDVLVLVVQEISTTDAQALGRDPSNLGDDGLWMEEVHQLHPLDDGSTDVVWTWKAIDHLVQDLDPALPDYGVVAETPGRLDLNPPGSVSPDFLHLNAIDHDPVHDRIVLSSLGFSEAWVLDHGITTEEARGTAGDLIYRWGNPQSYGSFSGEDQDFHLQHDVHWIPQGLPGAGDLLLFENGPPGTTGPLSRAMQVVLPLDEDGAFTGFDARWGPESFEWAWPEPPTGELASDQLGSAQRLPNGNTLSCEGEHGRLVEVTHGGEVVWEWLNPMTADGAVPQGELPEYGTQVRANALFRATRIQPDHPGLAGRALTPGVLLEEWVALAE